MPSLQHYFQQLTTEGGHGNFLIIHLPENAYLQFASEKGSSKIYCEASKIPNSLNQVSGFMPLGWQDLPSEYHNNYSQTLHLSAYYSLNDLEELIHATTKIYGCTEKDYRYELNLE